MQGLLLIGGPRLPFEKLRCCYLHASRQSRSTNKCVRGICNAAQASPSQYFVIGFDLDDTLWDTMATLREAHVAMVGAAPRLPEPQKSPAGFATAMRNVAEAHPGRSHDLTFLRKEALRLLLPCEEDVEKAYGSWFAARNSPAFYPGAVEALRELKNRGFRLCAISDGNSNPLDIPQLKGMFEFAVSAIEAGAAKPNPEPFLLAAQKANVPCSAMVYVGDNYAKDVLGAQAVGMQAIWVRTTRSMNEDFPIDPKETNATTSVADAEVRAVADLPEALIAMLQRAVSKEHLTVFEPQRSSVACCLPSFFVIVSFLCMWNGLRIRFKYRKSVEALRQPLTD